MRNQLNSSRNLASTIGILYEDERYIVFDKPPGLLVIATPKKERHTLVNCVNDMYAVDGSWKLHPCHRLDRETSGAILFAKGKRNQQIMMESFKKREVKKEYIAFIHGKLKKHNGEFRSSVCHLDHKKYHKNVKGKSAITQYNVVEERKQFSVVEVKPVTGRTNQIRIHFTEHGHPLVGERKYAFARDYHLKFRRTALHSVSLQWQDPITHKSIHTKSNLSKDMEVFLARN